MNLNQFVMILERIARHWNPKQDTKTNLLEMIEGRILNFAATPKHDKGMVRRIRRILDNIYLQDITEAFEIVNTQMSYYFNHYTRRQDLMNFNQFFLFCRDFGVFPGVITRIKLF